MTVVAAFLLVAYTSETATPWPLTVTDDFATCIALAERVEAKAPHLYTGCMELTYAPAGEIPRPKGMP